MSVYDTQLIDEVHELNKTFRAIANLLAIIAKVPSPFDVTGIEISPGTPTQRTVMKPNVKLVKKTTKAAAAAPVKAGAAVVDFVIQDNQDCTFTVLGTDSAGNTVDISTVATLTPVPTSSDTTALTVDPPTNMTFTVHGLKVTAPGSPVQVTATATWNDGSHGPFTFTLPVDLKSGGPTGITIVPGVPTVR